VTYFVIIYNRRSGEVTWETCADRHRALSRRFELEKQLRSLPDYEIVVLGGADLEQIKRTHGRYFKGVGELAAS
jgi:hypothetical protein